MRFRFSCDSPGGEQDWNGWDWKTNLLCEDGQKHDHFDMMQKKFQSLLHDLTSLCSLQVCY